MGVIRASAILAIDNSFRTPNAVVRALASHQCGSGSILRLDVTFGLSFLVLYSAPGGFSSVTPVFLSPQKPTYDLMWVDLNSVQGPQVVPQP